MGAGEPVRRLLRLCLWLVSRVRCRCARVGRLGGVVLTQIPDGEADLGAEHDIEHHEPGYDDWKIHLHTRMRREHLRRKKWSAG